MKGGARREWGLVAVWRPPAQPLPAGSRHGTRAPARRPRRLLTSPGPLRHPRTPALRPTPQARSELALAPAAYSLPAFLAYALYPPLYIAGPTLGFNAFASQLAAPPACVTPRATALYWARGVAAWATLEAMTHTLWFYSVSRHRLWEAAAAAAGGRPPRPMEMVLIPWWMMLLVWCKFLVIWRFFR